MDDNYAPEKYKKNTHTRTDTLINMNSKLSYSSTIKKSCQHAQASSSTTWNSRPVFCNYLKLHLAAIQRWQTNQQTVKWTLTEMSFLLSPELFRESSGLLNEDIKRKQNITILWSDRQVNMTNLPTGLLIQITCWFLTSIISVLTGLRVFPFSAMPFIKLSNCAAVSDIFWGVALTAHL